MKQPFIPVAAAIVWHQDQVLIARRAPSDALADMWEFPGGKIESGESPQACLRREFMEELGLPIDVGNPMMTVRDEQKMCVIELQVFQATALTRDVICHVHTEARWVAVSALAGFVFAPADRPVVHRLLSETKPAPIQDHP